MHCLELILDAMGRPLDYNQLMGLGGAAFRVQMHRAEWDAAAADPFVGYDVVAPIMQAIGVEYQIHAVDNPRSSEADVLRRDVTRSIEAGVPVLANNIIPPTDWGIITGYNDGGSVWLCRAYADDARNVDRPVRDWPAGVVVVSPPAAIANLRPAYLESIHRAISLYETGSADEYVLGRAALEAWAEKLNNVTDRQYMHANAWLYVSLVDARRAAAEYLKALAALMPDQRGHLQAAADLYAREAALLADAQAHVPFPRQYQMGFPPATIRARQATALRQASELERQAVEALKRVR